MTAPLGILTLLTPPALEPVTLAEARVQVRMDDGVTIEDALLERAIVAARRMAEHRLGHALITRTYTLALDAFPACAIALQVRRVAAITSVTYLDSLAAPQTLAGSAYTLSEAYPYSQIAAATTWPAGATQVLVTFTAGFGLTPDLCPAEVRNWILLQVGAFMRNREAFAAGQSVAELPGRWVEGLLDPEREYTIA